MMDGLGHEGAQRPALLGRVARVPPHRERPPDPHLAPGRLVRLAEPGRRLAHQQEGPIMNAARIPTYKAQPVIKEAATPTAGVGEVLVRGAGEGPWGERELRVPSIGRGATDGAA